MPASHLTLFIGQKNALEKGHLINTTKIFTKLTLTSWFLTHKLFKLAMQAKHQANSPLKTPLCFCENRPALQDQNPTTLKYQAQAQALAPAGRSSQKYKEALARHFHYQSG